MKIISFGYEYFISVKCEVEDIFNKIINSFINTRGYIHLVGKVRRFLLVHFRKDYVQKQLLLRKGECKQCGMCCNLLYTCPMLNKHGQCLIYGKCRPMVCKIFPIDQKDIDEIKMCGGKCGYYFE